MSASALRTYPGTVRTRPIRATGPPRASSAHTRRATTRVHVRHLHIRHRATAPIRPGSVEPMTSVLGQGDPTGLSSPLGQLVVLAGLLASLTLMLRWWWQNRRR